MGLIKFELKKEHISLFRNVDLNNYFDNYIDIKNGDCYKKKQMYDEFGLILFGKRDFEFDPTLTELPDWSDEEKEIMDKYHDELQTVIELIRQTCTIEPGLYKTKHYCINWKKA